MGPFAFSFTVRQLVRFWSDLLQDRINCVVIVEKFTPLLLKAILSCPEKKTVVFQEPLLVFPRKDNGEGRLLYSLQDKLFLNCT